MAFPELPTGSHLERAIQASWGEHDVPGRHLAHRRGERAFVFYEGPPTANGRPALHHVFSRTLKDTICRHRLMTGHFVPRQAGWDTQGLPVEIEVQKQLGISTRTEIEGVGVAEFNRRCRESVFTYLEEWETLSRRMAYWLDYENAYVTLEPEYIESCWAILSRFHAAGLLERDFKVLPYCPRCSTGLSNHEVAQGYEDVQDPSVYVRFRCDEAGWSQRAAALFGAPAGSGPVPSLLVWTTTPWTLPSNVAIAAHPELSYALCRPAGDTDERLILAAELVTAVLGEDAEVLGTTLGAGLLDLRYRRPIEDVELPDDETAAVACSVRLADYVSATDGTGLVHTAPAFGVDDFSLRAKDGLPLVRPVDDEGRFTEAVRDVAGQFVKDADKTLIRRLKDEGSLFRQQTIQHSYPHCWRCRSPLIYMARPSWYIRTTTFAQRMLELNATIDWHPPEIGQGRFGEWLSHNVDWALSRERYWGTPLNVWVCDGCEHQVSIDSFEMLAEKTGQTLPEDFDPHRPGIDAYTMPCDCGGTLSRTPEVVDCWFDSGAMPFAQAGWPKQTGGKLPEFFPADFISEGLDQTRGWFYTLHAIATFLTHDLSGGASAQPAYKACLVNNMLLDAQGKKMSKSRGNVADPGELFEQVGVDAVRWFFLSSGQVWLPKRFDAKAVAEGARRTFGTLHNCYAFLALYAGLEDWGPGDPAPPAALRPSIDRWLLSRLETLTREVGAAYQDLDLTEATRRLDAFIDRELSNWYVRRNRSRFWKSDESDDQRAAFATLGAALERVALLMAPAAPHLAEGLWHAVTAADDSASVHLADWPEVNTSLIDADLEADMAAVLAAVELGRSVRATHDIRTRQPLARVLVKASDPGDAARLRRPELARLVCEELNVRAVEVVQQADFRELSAKPDFKTLGKRLGPKMKAVAGAVAKFDEAVLEVAQAGAGLTVEVDGETIALAVEDLVFVEKGRQGYAVASDGRLVLALDTQLDDDLIAEGRAREIVNRVQNTRKSSGLDVADRVVVSLGGSADLLSAARRHEALILREVLGTELRLVEDGLPDGAAAFEVDGAELGVLVEKV